MVLVLKLILISICALGITALETADLPQDNTSKQLSSKSWEEDIIQNLPDCPQSRNDDSTVTIKSITISTRISGTLAYPGTTLPYPSNCKLSWLFQVEPGYGIDVTVDSLDLDGQAGDVLFIRGGRKDTVSSKGVMLSWKLEEPRKFSIGNTNELFVLFVAKNVKAGGTFKGFQMQYQRHGELTTTQAPTTTTQPLPTSAPGGARPDILVNLLGSNPQDFHKNLKNFTTVLAEYTKTFCNDLNITSKDPITENNIVMNLITYCPRYWPNTDNCVQIRFSIPIELQVDAKDANASNTNYELSEINLIKLWNGFSKTELKKMNYKVYDDPDESYYLSLWMGVTLGTLGIVLVAFLGILYWIWRTSISKDYASVGSNSNSLSSTYRSPAAYDLGLDPGKKRSSDSSLYEDPHQVVPGFFEESVERRNQNYQHSSIGSVGPPPTYGSRTSDETDWSNSNRGAVNEAYEAEERPGKKSRMNIPSKASAELPENYWDKLKGPIRISGGNNDESKI